MSILFHPTTKRVSLWVLVITLFLFPITSAIAAQVTLAWDPNNPVPDGYRVFARVDGQNYDFNTPVWPGQGDDATQTSCTLDNLADGTTYHFVVRAFVGTTESGNSNEVLHITDPAVPVLHTISTAAGAHGSVSPSSATVASGSSQTFTISADAGYHIMDVQVDGNSVGPVGSYTFSEVNGDHTLSASFTSDTHTITVSSGANGSISPSTTTVSTGGSQTFTISAAANYHIADVLVDGNSVGAVSSYTFSGVNGDHTLSASFTSDTHTITVSSGANGSISPSTTTVSTGGSQTFTISAAANYHITDVLVDGNSVGAVSSYTFSGVNGNHTLSASFAADTHTISVVAGANGRISPSTITVSGGDTQTFTIAPDSDCQVVDVLVDGQSMGAVTSYIFEDIWADHTIAATFKSNADSQEVNIWIEAEDGDIYAPMEINGDTAASAGGYVWTPEGGGGIVSSSSPDAGWVEHRFDIPTEGDYVVWGRVNVADTSSDSFYVYVDGLNEITWHTKRDSAGLWVWDVVSVRNPLDEITTSNPFIYHLTAGTHTITVKQREDGTKLDKILVTNMLNLTPDVPVLHTISTAAGAHGSVSPSSATVASGSSQTFTISADAGYHIMDVQVDGNSVGPVGSYTFSEVNGDHTLSASFTSDTHTITVSSGANGGISPSTTTVSTGGSQTFTISAAANYHITDVLVDGNSVGAVSSYTFSGVNGDHTLSASFTSDTHTITVSSGANGSISPSTTTVSTGGSQTFTISAAANYHITDVLVDGNSVGAVSSYTFSGVNGNHTLSASFAADTHTISVVAGANGRISPSTITVSGGDTQTFTITPYSDCQVVDVLVDGQSMGAVTSYIFEDIWADHTIAATFKSNADSQEVNIWIEAEDGDIYAPMEINGDTAASAGGYVWTPEGGGGIVTSSSPDAGWVEHRFDIPTEGDYVVWGRVNVADTSSDSFYVYVDGLNEITWHTKRDSAGIWVWDVVSVRNPLDEITTSNPFIYHLTAGTHTITVKQREDGTKLDKILVTNRLDLSEADVDVMGSGGAEVNIWIEAEDGDIYAPMETSGDTAASAGGYVWTPEGGGGIVSSSSPDAGWVEHRFDIPTEGDYVVWGRVNVADTSSDSFYVYVDGLNEITWHTKRDSAGIWVWDVVSIRNPIDEITTSNPFIYHLTAGTHTITVKQREDGTKLDKILVTSKLNITPAELE